MAVDEKCPLCLETMDQDDLSFYPCDCHYQICRFCWTKIINESDSLCPACRKKYNSEEPALYKPAADPENDVKSKFTRKKRDNPKKKLTPEMLKILPELRVVQPNLIFVVGLTSSLCKDKEQLKSHSLFGRFGKVFKVEVNQNQTFGGSQGQLSYSAYITYYRAEDAMQCVRHLDQTVLNGRSLRVSLGTTKYCSQFLRGLKCNKHECMYLHEVGDSAASFTKEEMQQGKHTEYMNKLLKEMVSRSGSRSVNRNSPSEGESPVPPFTEQSSRVVSQDAVSHRHSRSKNDRSVPSSKPRTHTSNSDVASHDGLESSIANSSDQGACSNNWTQPSDPVSQSCPTPSSTDLFVIENQTAPNEINPRVEKPPESESLQCSSSYSCNDWAEGYKSVGVETIDIDFDPIHESQLGLADLLASERLSKSDNNRPVMNGHPPFNCMDAYSMNLCATKKGINCIPGAHNTLNGDWSSNNTPPTHQITDFGKMSNRTSQLIRPPPGFEDNISPLDPINGAFFQGERNFPTPVNSESSDNLHMNGFTSGDYFSSQQHQHAFGDLIGNKSKTSTNYSSSSATNLRPAPLDLNFPAANITEPLNRSLSAQPPGTQNMLTDLFITAYNTATAMLESNTSSSEVDQPSKPPFDMNSFFEELCNQYPSIYKMPPGIHDPVPSSSCRSIFNSTSHPHSMSSSSIPNNVQSIRSSGCFSTTDTNVGPFITSS